jgi:2-oxoisovalerate ferredoxin oxidoreductase beta subunit
VVKHAKPKGFYDTFDRKTTAGGPASETTHYCPGCGHGTVHKLIAEALADMGIKDRTVFLSPVGCSVFGYYYFDTGNIQCAHGRAPAVGTGVSRSLDDAVVISYQGDGDLAGIGTAEIVHAANRGENMAVFFVNNAIYGMTGGQLAPTTILGQVTTTSPLGRLKDREGGPIHMSEMLDALDGPAYIERCSLADAGRVMKTRKAIRKALSNQVERRGFSFVEILSPCPVGWKMTSTQARNWIKETMESVFEVKTFRDREDSKKGTGRLPMMDDVQLKNLLGADMVDEVRAGAALEHIERVKIAGFGGQGVMSAGVLLANAAIAEGLEATWLPSYGPEMRGGTANASVVLSNEPVGSPVVDRPTALLAMNGPSLDGFEDTVVPGGLIIVNSSLIKRKVKRTDVKAIHAPISAMAAEAGFLKGANIVMLALYMLEVGVPGIETLNIVIPKSLKKKEMVGVNLKLVKVAEEFHAKG